MASGPDAARPTLSVIVPAWNEARRIGATLERLHGWLTARYPDTEILVVDDGSRDETSTIAAASGMLYARGAIRLMSDADLSTPIEELPRFLGAIQSGADVVIGSRSLTGSRILRHQPWYREQLGRQFNRIVQATLMRGIIDTQCGFKCLTADAAQRIFSRSRIDGFAFDVELLLIARRLSLQVAELPVQWIDHPDSRVGPLRDSSRMLAELARIGWYDRQGGYR
jgi:dolichyl-phosphate beta-glucosyltransferase